MRSRGLTPTNVLQAVAGAKREQPAWTRLGVAGRLRVVQRLRGIVAERAGEFTEAVGQRERRQPGATLGAEVLPLLEACLFLEREGESILSPRRMPARLGPPPVGGVAVEVRREPFGIVLIVAPSNYPLLLPGIQAMQALAAGNAVLWKPGRGGTPAAVALSNALSEAGLPGGLCAVLAETPQAARAAIEEGVDRVVLTGSAETGQAVLQQLAPRLVPATMELSGCDAVFVLDGADVAEVAKALTFGLRLNGGATCMAPRRVFVPRRVCAQMEKSLAMLVAPLPAYPVDPPTVKVAAELVREALEGGARLLCGDVPAGDRCRPVVLTDARPQMRLLKEDVFAPVLSLVPVRDLAEALAADGVCPYALGTSVFGPAQEARAAAARIDAGVVVINDIIVPTIDPRLPFGGRRRSGFGVTRGAEGLLEMTRVKAVAESVCGWKPHLAAPREEDEHMLRLIIRARHAGSLRSRAGAFVELAKRGARRLLSRARLSRGE